MENWNKGQTINYIRGKTSTNGLGYWNKGQVFPAIYIEGEEPEPPVPPVVTTKTIMILWNDDL
jgi:hypothetical protein